MSGQPSVFGMAFAIRSAVAACYLTWYIGFHVRLTIRALEFASGVVDIGGSCVRLINDRSDSTLSVGFFVGQINYSPPREQ